MNHRQRYFPCLLSYNPQIRFLAPLLTAISQRKVRIYSIQGGFNNKGVSFCLPVDLLEEEREDQRTICIKIGLLKSILNHGRDDSLKKRAAKL